MAAKKPKMKWHKGGCHCGAVTYEVLAPSEVELVVCNCSICSMTGYQHLIVSKDQFKLLTGKRKLTNYTFETGAAKHLFCSVCGVKSFYVPRSNPDGFSVNLRCLDPGTVEQVTVQDFDGLNWERHGASLAHLSHS